MHRGRRAYHLPSALRKLGRRRYNSDGEDDEELLFSSEQNTYTANDTLVEVATGRQRKLWRTLAVGKPESVLHTEEDDCFVVFPAGIYLRVASNPNPADILLSFDLPGLHGDNTKVVIPSMGSVKDVEILRPPEEGGPRSQKWCELFGIVSISAPSSYGMPNLAYPLTPTPQITGENLKKGIVETRGDTDLVVWRRFRHNVDMLTPFALFDVENLDSSTSQYMVYTQEQYDKLLAACSGVRCGDITVKAEALFQKMQNIDLKPVNIRF